MKPFINWLTARRWLIDLNGLLWIAMFGAVLYNPGHEYLLPIAVTGQTFAVILALSTYAARDADQRRRTHPKTAQN